MATFWYLSLMAVGVVGAMLVGLASHFWHAHFRPYPDQLFGDRGWGDKLLNELISPEYTIVGKYDDGGWWEFYSLRNYAIHAVPCVLLVIAFGVLNWSDRAGTIVWICEAAGRIGLFPPAC